MGSHFIRPMILVASLGLIVGCAEMSEQETGQASGGTGSSVSSAGAVAVTGIGARAAGAVGDTLQFCQDRIPEGASAGQRMLAEQSCTRDQGDRRLIQAVPGR
ncbi:MAG: hypothetical protein ACKOCD_09430 [Nitrospiraceae bacterium]